MSIWVLASFSFFEVVGCNRLSLPEGVRLPSFFFGYKVLDSASGFSPFLNSSVTVSLGKDHPVQLRNVDSVLVQVLNSVGLRFFICLLPDLGSSFDDTTCREVSYSLVAEPVSQDGALRLVVFATLYLHVLRANFFGEIMRAVALSGDT